MNRTALVARNLRYHFRGNLAVLLGVAIGSAVLTGALLVGDSLRGSLRERAERQLAGIDNLLVGSRLLRQDLPGELPGTVRGALLLQGTVQDLTSDARVGKVTVWGVDGRFGIAEPLLDSDQPIAILSADLARQLRAKVGDPITVGVQKASAMPKSSFLGRRGVSDSTKTIKLTVHAILPDDAPANGLSLSISPSLPLNMFVPVSRLQREIEQSGRINALLAAGAPSQSLQAALKEHLTLDDWNLTVRTPPSGKGYISVESTRLLLEPAIVTAIDQTAREMNLRTAHTYTYLANTISDGTNEVPYSIVAAVEPMAKAPLGPFLPEGIDELQPNEIILVNWPDTPLRFPAIGMPVDVTYFKPEIESKIEEATHKFVFRGTLPLAGAADDRYLTPDFPGITDRANLRSWNPPFEIQQGRIKPRDEKFWDKYRTTPKAYIRLDDGQRLWGTRFGDVTSIRIDPGTGADIDKVRTEFAERLRKNLDPLTCDLAFQPIRERMLEAGRGSTDFGVLFLSFSFFLIVAALMLVGLLFRLNLERRAREVGLLRATGFPLTTVRRMLLLEGLMIAVVGSLVGIAGAIGYAAAMIRLLVKLWPTPGVETFLRLHISPESLAIGFGASVLMSVATIYWALRALSRIAPAQLLKGDTTPALAKFARPSPWPKRIIIVSMLCAIALAVMGPFMPPGEPRAGTFFGSGGLLLVAGLTLLWAWLKRPRHALVHGHGNAALARLGSRNVVRNPVRSVLTAGLLASAAFLLVAVESFRREPEKNFLDAKGGSGGYNLIAELSTPIDFDPADKEGRDETETGLELDYQARGVPSADRASRMKNDLAQLEGVTFARLRVQGGDDASCLNLYQAGRPRVLGVPQSLIERGGFSFAGTLAEPDNPWKQLTDPPVGEPVPCIVEQNTAMWMLKLGIGDTFEVPDQSGQMMTLKIVALIKDSVFQSEVLIADAAFRRHFPRTEGFGYFLIQAPPDRVEAVADVLARALQGYGFDPVPARQKVAQYLAVQNTYLTTFQLLGGLGLVLGVLGLAVVLLRSIWERRSELALMRALGYRKRSLQRLVFAENALLLLVGLAAGIIAALAAVAPHLIGGGQVPWLRLAVMLGAAVVVGLSVAWIAVVGSLRAPLIPALREE